MSAAETLLGIYTTLVVSALIYMVLYKYGLVPRPPLLMAAEAVAIGSWAMPVGPPLQMINITQSDMQRRAPLPEEIDNMREAALMPEEMDLGMAEASYLAPLNTISSSRRRIQTM
jgi:hypothetical protein